MGTTYVRYLKETILRELIDSKYLGVLWTLEVREFESFCADEELLTSFCGLVQVKYSQKYDYFRGQFSNVVSVTRRF